MKRHILRGTKVVISILLVFLIVLYIKYLMGYQYYAVHKVGSINLNYEFNGAKHWYDINISRDSVLRFLEQYHDDIQDEEEYQKLYQTVENQSARALFVISRGASIRYFEYYHGDDLYCLPVYGEDQPGGLYIYRVYRKLPEIG